LLVHGIIAGQDIDRHLEREEQLVRFEETTAHIVVQGQREVIVEALDTDGRILVLAWRVVDRASEELSEPLQ